MAQSGKKKLFEKGVPRWLPAAVWLAAVACFGLSLAYQRCFLLDYNPVDGDFQSYNVFRRMLAGQAPYADFANYVGMAPVVLNLPFLLLDGSFAASLFVTNFTCNVLFSLCVLVVFWLVTQNTPVSLLVSALLSKVVSTGVLGLLGGPGAYLNGLYTNLYTPSNSMRIARSFWPFLLVLLCLLLDKVCVRRTGRHFGFVAAPARPRFCAAAGAVAGLGVTWSNDFGLAVVFSATLLAVLLLAKQKPGAKRLFANLGIYTAALAAGAFVSAFLATGGHPSAWLRATFATGGAQYYYFNGASGKALLTVIFTNPRLLAYTAAYVAFLVWCLVRLVRGKLGDLELLGGFLALSVLAATYAYILSGSGYNFTEALEGFFWIAAGASLARGILWLLRRWDRQAGLTATALLCAGAVLVVGTSARDAVAQARRPREGVYVEALGGYTNYTGALVDAAVLTAGEDVFSVYATGLEVVKGRFQPSGYDYIIHALGTDAQDEYVQRFLDEEWAWAQTTNLGLEGWLCLGNWYFYRHLAARYERVAETEYSWLWARTGEAVCPVADAVVTVEPDGDGNWVVEVSVPGGVDCTADVRVAYDTKFTSAGGRALSLGRRCVAVSVPDPVGDGERVWGYFEAESGGLYIPIAVRDGVGRATLVPCDNRYVSLAVHSAELDGLLPDLRTS